MKRARYALASAFLLAFALILGASIPTVPTNTWVAGSNLNEIRDGAASALLQDGSILTTGGASSAGVSLTAEVLGADGTTAAVASMQVARSRHTATLLDDGRVLVVGGDTGAGAATNSAEIYDPGNNSWSSAGTLAYARFGHTATLLEDGRVLIAGGENAGIPVPALEIYDPNLNTFTYAANLHVVRKNHAASILDDGRVLIVGGFGLGQDSSGKTITVALSSAEIFNPTDNSVTAIASLNVARGRHTATKIVDGNIVVAGGNDGQNDLASIEIYDTTTQTWGFSGATLATPRSGHVAALLPNNNSVLIWGGSSNASGTPTQLQTAEMYYSWGDNGTLPNAAVIVASAGTMNAARVLGTGSAFSLEGLYWAAGGSGQQSTELFRFVTLKTDKSDYAPSTPVYTAGSGFLPNETVYLHLHEELNDSVTDHPNFITTADSNGNIAYTIDGQYVELSAGYHLTAIGQSSGFQAQTVFTDGNASNGDGTMTVGPTSVTAGSTGDTLTFTFASPNGGDFTSGSQTTIQVPAGWTPPTTAAGAGHVSVATGPSPACTAATLVGITGNGPWTITINMTCPAKDQFTVTYSGVTAPTAAGVKTFTAQTKQNGGTLTNISTSPTVTVQASTTTSLISSGTPTVFGQPVTFTATVSTVAPAAGTPIGTVTFNDGATAICSNVALNGSAQATCTTTSLSADSHSVNAVYNGSSDTPQSFTGSTSSPITQTVNQASTTTSVSSSANPSVFGQSVTFTASVTTVAPGSGTPAGTVSFYDGGTCTSPGTTLTSNVALNGSGIATTSTSSLSVSGSPHAIIACYAGNPNYNTSNGSLSQMVNQASTTTAVVSSANPSNVGQSVTFTATVNVVSPGSGTRTGTVTFNDGATAICSNVTLSANQATCATSSLSIGSHSITAVYSGDTNFAGSTSSTLSQTVNPILAFTTPAFSLAAGSCSSQITVQAQDGSGNPVNVSSNTTVTLSDTGAGTFYSNSNCSTSTTSVTISSGTSSASFYFKDNNVQSTTLNAVAFSYTATQAETIDPKLAFTSSAFSVEVSQCSPAITVQTQNGTGGNSNVSSTTTVNLSSNSGGGQFFSNNTCTIGTTTTTIASGSSISSSFYYKDGNNGTPTITASAFSGVSTAQQTETVSFPAIASVTGPANGNYGIGANLDFKVNYSVAVTVNTSGGTPYIGLTIGSNTPNANYVSGSGTSQLTFRYTVQSGDLASSGISSASPIVLNGGTIADLFGNVAPVTFNPPNTSAVLVDGVSPVTASVTTPADGTFFSAGTGPASFSGSAADNASGLGLNTNGTTFTLQRGSDSLYWNGTAWQAGVFNLTTTQTATTGGTVATWTRSTGLPTWSSESGSYTVQATATDKAGNTFTGTAVTFTILGTVSPRAIGTQATNNPTGVTSLAQSGVTLPAGNTVFVTVAMDANSSSVTVSDNAAGGSNTYNKDADVSNGSGTNGIRTLVFSTSVVHALSNSTITINISGSADNNIAATFFSFNGLVSSPFDKSHTGFGTSTTTNMSLSSGALATATSQPDELLIGAMGIEAKSGGSGFGSFTAGTSGAGANATYSLLGQSGTSGGQATNNLTIQPEYQVASVSGAYSASATISNANIKWAAAISTYKIKTPTASIFLRDASPVANGAMVNFTVTFSEGVAGVESSDFVLAQSGVSGSSIGSVADSGDHTTYTVTVTIGTGTGTVGLNLVDDDSIKSISTSIRLGGTGTGNGNVTGPTYSTPNQAATSLSAAAVSGTYGGTTNLSATLTSGGSGVSGKTINFTLSDGTHTVTASAETGVDGAATANSVSVAGLNVGIYASGVSASFTPDSSYLGSSGINSLTVIKANQAVLILNAASPLTYNQSENLSVSGGTTNGAVTYNLVSGPCALVGSQVTASSGTGNCVLTATMAGNDDYNDVTSDQVTVNLAKANATINVAPYNVTYDGNAHTATGSATGVSSEDLSSLLTLSGTTHTRAGDYPSDPWSFAGNSNYNSASGTVHDNIAKANAVISVTPYSVTYDGNAHTATGTATGVKDEILSGLDLSGTTHTNAGSYAIDPWTFTDVTGNYNNASGTVSDSIAKANAAINVTPYSVTYDGNAHTATGTATGVNSENLSGLLDLSGTTHTNAGTYIGDAWSFAGNGNYSSTSATVNDSISKAGSTTTVTCPASVTYNGSPQTPCSAAVTGAGGLSQPVPVNYVDNTNAGTATASASFAGDSNHTSSSDSKTFAINKADQTITVTAPDPFPTSAMYGTSFTATATGGASGNVVLIAGSGACGGSGNNSALITMTIGTGTCTVTFNQLGNVNYYAAPQVSQSVIALLAPQSIAFTDPTTAPVLGDAVFNEALSATSGESVTVTSTTPAVCKVNGDLNTGSSTASVPVTIYSAGTCTLSASVGGDLNYSAVGPTTHNVTINKYTIAACPYTGCFDDNHNPTPGGYVAISNSVAYLGQASVTVTLTPDAVSSLPLLKPVDGDSTTPKFTVYLVQVDGNGNPIGSPILFGSGKATPTTTPAGYQATIQAALPNTVVPPNTYKAYVYGDDGGTLTSTVVAADAGYTAADTADFVYPTLISNILTVIKANQAVLTLNAASPLTYNQSENLSVSGGTTNGAVTYNLVSGPCTLVGSQLTASSGTGSCVLTATMAGNDDYNDVTSDQVTVNLAKANATINVTPYSVTYDGNAHTATGSATGVTSEDLSSLLTLSGTTHTIAGDYPSDPWSFAGNINYNPASGTVHDSIAKANAVISVTSYSVTYDGNAHTATGTATGVKGETLSGLDLSGTTHANAGTYATDPWTFIDVTGNYNNASGTVSDSIAKANAAINITPYSVTYDSNPHTATGTATGVKGETLSGLNLTGTTHINAGTYATDPWTFTDSTGNYNNASGTVSDSIAKANAAISVTPYSVTYDGNAHTATGSATGVTSEDLSSLLTLSGTTHTSAGDYPSDAWSFAGNSNYNPASGTVSDSIGKANAAISVTPYSVTYDGSSHTATGSAKGVGGVTLSGLGLSGTTHTNAGTYATDPWTFTDVTGNYNNASGTVSDSIGKATPSFSGLAGPTITFGTGPTSLSGAISAGSLYPSGSVSITLNGSSQAAAISSTAGAFSSSFSTGALSSGIYTITYSYAGDSNFISISNTSNKLTVSPEPASGNILAACANGDPTTCPPAGSVTNEQVYEGYVNFNIYISPVTYNSQDPASGADIYICPIGWTTANGYATCQAFGTVTFNGSSPVTLNAQLLETVSGALAPGTHPVVADYRKYANPNFSINSGTGIATSTLKIDPAPASPPSGWGTMYTGASVFWTPNATSNAATLYLSATVYDPACVNLPAGYCSTNVTKGTVTFGIRSSNSSSYTPITGATNLPIGLVDPSNPAVGSAAATVQYSIPGGASSANLQIAVIVGGYYTANNTALDSLVTVAIPPTSGSLLFAGTSLCDGTNPSMVAPKQQNLPCLATNGTYQFPLSGVLVGTPSELAQVQGGVQWSKSGSNPKGQILAQVVSYYLPNGQLDTKPHTYVLKSNAISTFVVSSVSGGTGNYSQFTSKASIYDISTGASVDGGALMNITVCSPNATCPTNSSNSKSTTFTAGSNGAISFQVNNSKTGGAWVVTGWNGVNSVPQNAVSGQVIIAR